MSARGESDVGAYSIAPEWLLYSRLSDRAVRLYLILARHADRAGECFPSRSRLARLMGCSLPSIDRALDELRQIGAVSTKLRRSAKGDLTSSLYIVRYAKPEGGVITREDTPTLTSDDTYPHRCEDPTLTGDETVSSPVMTELKPIERKPVEREPRKSDRAQNARSGERKRATAKAKGWHDNHAWCADRSGLCVPNELHKEFAARGLQSDQVLFTFYRQTVDRVREWAIPDSKLKFWEDAFKVWLLEVCERRVGWRSECARDHGSQCWNEHFHIQRKQADAGTQALAQAVGAC